MESVCREKPLSTLTPRLHCPQRWAQGRRANAAGQPGARHGPLSHLLATTEQGLAAGVGGGSGTTGRRRHTLKKPTSLFCCCVLAGVSQGGSNSAGSARPRERGDYERLLERKRNSLCSCPTRGSWQNYTTGNYFTSTAVRPKLCHLL